MSNREHEDVTRRSFERQVGLFVGEDAPFARREGAAMSWFEPLEPAMVVLDVACGAAHVSEQIAPHVRQVVGIDLTPALLEAGSARLRDGGITNVLLQEANAVPLPFVDASFDLVVCRTALHHFAEPERATAEMGRVCRAGARVAIADMVAPSAAVRNRFDEVHRLIDPSHVGVFVGAELQDVVRAGVGDVCGLASETFALPIDLLLTEVADHGAVMSALRAELAGGPPTGLEPAVDDDDQIAVSFTISVVHATARG